MEWPGVKRKKYSINYMEVEIRKCVRTIVNIGGYFMWLLDCLRQERWYESGHPLFTTVHLREFVRLCSAIIENYDEAEPADKFKV